MKRIRKQTNAKQRILQRRWEYAIRNAPAFKERYSELLNLVIDAFQLSTSLHLEGPYGPGSYIGIFLSRMVLDFASADPLAHARLLATEAHLGLLVAELNSVRETNPRHWERLRRVLGTESQNRSNYYGAAAELHFAAHLSCNGYTYATPEPPDFKVAVEGFERPLFVECVTKGPKELSKQAHRYVLDVIDKKDRKYVGQEWYDVGTAILLVDLNRLNYLHAKETGAVVMTDEFVRSISRRIDRTNYTSILFSVQILSDTDHSARTRFISIDRSSASDEALELKRRVIEDSLVRSSEGTVTCFC